MVNTTFSQQERVRYARHFALPDFGIQGQIKLKNSRVLVVGAGGLGCPVLLYLAAAGVGCIGIIDGDVVDDSNLQRQVLYTVADIGKSKAVAAKERLLAMNPHIEIEVFKEHLTSENALGIISKFDVVADGTDNFPTRYLVNDACVLAGKVNVYASIFRFEGQLSVFNLPQNDGERGVNYRDIFPTPPPAGLIPDCAEGGVLGVLPGIIGSMQANEIIKVLTSVGEPLAGRLFLFDAQSFTAKSLKIKKNLYYKPIQRLIDYQIFCGVKTVSIPEISIIDFKKMQSENAHFQLIDVREPCEYTVSNLGGTLYPLSILAEKTAFLSKNLPIIVHCQSGSRSAKAVEALQKLGFDNAVSLAGGIKAYNFTA
ncbi:MAG: molybdopterin-synthase adenylyltransferase MoeB [Saprospiraceae bacterium]|nr:molybdopterin-synthase adenylyltransferase MoeB [Saprospiraceae bacterium]